MTEDIDSAVARVREAAAAIRAMADTDLASAVRALPELDLATMAARLLPTTPTRPANRKKEVAKRTANPTEPRQRRPPGSLATMILGRLNQGDAAWSDLKTLGIPNGRLHTTIQTLIRANRVEWFGDPKKRVYRLVSHGQSTTTTNPSVR